MRNINSTAPIYLSFNRYDRNRTFDRHLRIGLVKELILQLTVSNKATDYAYHSKIVVKYPISLGYQKTSDVSSQGYK